MRLRDRLLRAALRLALAAAPLSAASLSGPALAHETQLVNDYPTEARADYVFGCMAVNGNTRAMLSRCSCSIDVIATILPYDDYVAAETVLSMRQVGGERMTIFRSAQPATAAVTELRRAQAEAELRCF